MILLVITSQHHVKNVSEPQLSHMCMRFFAQSLAQDAASLAQRGLERIGPVFELH